jgi:HAD superfamily hydrolase (TIGR01549 family)
MTAGFWTVSRRDYNARMNDRPRGIVFDLWNTLVASTAPRNPMVELGERLESFGIVPWLPAVEQEWMLRPIAGIEQALDAVARRHGVTIPGDMALDAAARWREGAASVALFPDVLPALDRLRRHFRLGLLSNTQSFDIEFLDTTGLRGRFDAVHLSCDTGLMKPDRRAFETIARELGIEPPGLVMVGDNWKDDVAGARAAGLSAILIRRNGFALSHEEATEGRNPLHTLDALESSLAGNPSSRPGE